MKENQEHGPISKHAAYFISGALLHVVIVLIVSILPAVSSPVKILVPAVCAVLSIFFAYYAAQASKLTYFLSFTLGIALATLIRQYIFWGWISARAFAVPLFYIPLLCAGIAFLILHRAKANA